MRGRCLYHLRKHKGVRHVGEPAGVAGNAFEPDNSYQGDDYGGGAATYCCQAARGRTHASPAATARHHLGRAEEEGANAIEFASASAGKVSVTGVVSESC